MNIVNSLSAGIALYAEIPNRATPNSTPQKLVLIPRHIYALVNQQQLIFGATDVNNDNLIYSLVTPYSGNNPPTNDLAWNPIIPGPYNLVTWNPPYSLANILGGTPAMSINPFTGLISVNPNTLGTFIFAVKVEEYRGGGC